MSSDGTQRPVAIRGITPANPAQPPARLELRDMRKTNPKQWNLFLLGFERFQQKSREDEDYPLSYYAIAGIHGAPFSYWPHRDWNKSETVNPGMNRGYCTHSSILFLTWHRPYLALFENELYKHVNAVANAFKDDEDKAQYVEAAKTFRLPYWDWARPNDQKDVTIFPWEAMSTTVHKVVRPGSKKVSTDLKPNPLAAYTFGATGKANPSINRFPKAGSTVRHPNAAGTGPNEELLADMADFFKEKEDARDGKPPSDVRKGKNLTERTLYVLQSYTEFSAMCQNKFPGKASFLNYGSLEDTHNSVHGYVGSGGHMANPQIAAFDPIFWLHHCNIDRLFAIWQALHPENTPKAYVTPQASTGTFSNKAGTEENVNTDLVPFTSSEKIGDYWTSDTVRDTKKFGYVYPETQNWRLPDKTAILKELDEIYQQGSTANIVLSGRNSSATFSTSVSELQARAVLHQQVAQVPISASMIATAVQTNDAQLPQQITSQLASLEIPEERTVEDLVKDNKYLEWLVDIRAEKHTQDGNFMVHVFLGPPGDDNAALYIFDPSHVGIFSTFGQPEDTGCVKCQADQAERIKVTGQIPLTVALVERYIAGLIDGLTPEAVEPYLQQNLHWRVTTGTGDRLGRADTESLLVAVVTNEVTLPNDPSGLPSYAPDVVPRPAATTNRDGEGRGKGTGYTG